MAHHKLNYMSNSSNFFVSDLKLPKVSRSKFNRSRTHTGSGKIGALYPVYCKDMLPGDKIKVNIGDLLHFEGLLAPQLSNMTLKFESFFVPNRLISSRWKDTQTQDENMGLQDSAPYDFLGVGFPFVHDMPAWLNYIFHGSFNKVSFWRSNEFYSTLLGTYNTFYNQLTSAEQALVKCHSVSMANLLNDARFEVQKNKSSEWWTLFSPKIFIKNPIEFRKATYEMMSRQTWSGVNSDFLEHGFYIKSWCNDNWRHTATMPLYNQCTGYTQRTVNADRDFVCNRYVGANSLFDSLNYPERLNDSDFPLSCPFQMHSIAEIRDAFATQSWSVSLKEFLGIDDQYYFQYEYIDLFEFTDWLVNTFNSCFNPPKEITSSWTGDDYALFQRLTACDLLISAWSFHFKTQYLFSIKQGSGGVAQDFFNTTYDTATKLLYRIDDYFNIYDATTEKFAFLENFDVNSSAYQTPLSLPNLVYDSTTHKHSLPSGYPDWLSYHSGESIDYDTKFTSFWFSRCYINPDDGEDSILRSINSLIVPDHVNRWGTAVFPNFFKVLGSNLFPYGAEDEVFPKINPYKFRAYNAVWNTYYRNEDLQDEIINNDALNDVSTPLMLRNRWYRRDTFTSALPYAQKGPKLRLGGTLANPGEELFPDDSGNGFTLQDLAIVKSVQRLFDRLTFIGTSYMEFIRGTFVGVTPPDTSYTLPFYVGSDRQPIMTSTVTQTSETTESSELGEMSGHMSATGKTRTFRFNSSEHGVFIILMSIEPELHYFQGLNRESYKVDKWDDYIPNTFDGIGNQAIKKKEIFCDWTNPIQDNTDFGYQERNYHLKVDENVVSGEIRRGLRYWIASRRLTPSRANLNGEFGEVMAEDYNNLFINQDYSLYHWQFVYQLSVNATWKRMMPYHSLPKL